MLIVFNNLKDQIQNKLGLKLQRTLQEVGEEILKDQIQNKLGLKLKTGKLIKTKFYLKIKSKTN